MLRIIGGTIRGRLIKVPRSSKIRPTSDKVRESIFNIIPPDVVNGSTFMDLFAGCGAVGIEALSRGAGHVTFTESDYRHARIIRENLECCGFKESSEVFCSDVLLMLDKILLHNRLYNIIFVDPPYNYPKFKILLPKIITNVKISDYGFMIVEHSSKVKLPEKIDDMALYGNYVYGDTALTVYRKDIIKGARGQGA